MPKLRIGRDSSGRQRLAHRPAEVEPTFSPPSSACETRGQFPGEWADGRFHLLEVLGGGVHQVDVFDQGTTQSTGHGVPTPVGHETSPDLVFDLLT
jgi:hypothetical protein